MSYETSRRTFLRSLGALAATMPFAKLLERSALGDPPSGPPLRLVCIRYGSGTPLEFWRPDANMNITGLNHALQPFDDAATYGSSFKNNMVIVEGINNLVADESHSGGHGSMPCIWTGSTINANRMPACESIETYLSVTKGLGSSTPYPTVFYGEMLTSFGAGGVALNGITNPPWLFKTLFSNFMPNTQSMQAQADMLARGKSTLDFVSGSLTGLQNRLAAPEKILLDQHLTAIRQIENRLMTGPGVCTTIPKAPTVVDTSNGDYVNSTVLPMFAQAIACDLTRFMQIFIADPGSPISSSAQDPGVNPPIPLTWPAKGTTCSGDPNTANDCCHIDVAHKYQASSPFALGGGGTADAITSQIRLARVSKYYMSYIASFMQQLKANSLLDSTLIMTMSDVGNPAAHTSHNLPVLLLGGANGYFKMGQYLPLSTPTSQNALFVSIANAFGLPITKYGVSANASTTAGPLPGLAA